MGKYRVTPREVEAVQFDGDNWVEMANFCGTRSNGDGGQLPVFTPMGTFIPTFFAVGGAAELWVEKHKKLQAVKIGEWVVKGDEGYFHISDQLFKLTFDSEPVAS